MNKNYELAKLQVEDIKQMFLEGKNVSTIGREIGVYPYNVAKILEELGLYKKLTKQERQDILSNYSETIIKWYTEGKSLRIIVDLLKSRDISTTQKTIKKILVENGIIGIFKNMFVPVSASLSIVLLSGVIAGFISKLKP